jgi:hypothetical protein
MDQWHILLVRAGGIQKENLRFVSRSSSAISGNVELCPTISNSLWRVRLRDNASRSRRFCTATKVRAWGRSSAREAEAAARPHSVSFPAGGSRVGRTARVGFSDLGFMGTPKNETVADYLFEHVGLPEAYGACCGSASDKGRQSGLQEKCRGMTHFGMLARPCARPADGSLDPSSWRCIAL